MKNTPIIIDWNYSGTPDGFFGTGATKAEQAIVLSLIHISEPTRPY